MKLTSLERILLGVVKMTSSTRQSERWLISALAVLSMIAPLMAEVEFVYHNYDQLTEFLNDTYRQFPEIAHLSTIGKSIEGRELWVLTLGKEPDRHTLLQPELQYIGNMHGNEVVSRELLIHYIDYMTRQYGKRDDVTRLLSNSRVHVMVSMNPDGFEKTNDAGDEGACRWRRNGRTNAANEDLNRNFPDYFEENPYPIQPETQAVMDWIHDVQFTLAGSLHGGGLAVVYPYSNFAVKPPECGSIWCIGSVVNYTDCSCSCTGELVDGHPCNPDPEHRGPVKNANYSRSTDDDVFRHISTAYASKNPTMVAGSTCQRMTFPPGGIINGAEWYAIRGGMQEYAYIYAGLMEVTLEVACCKFPFASELPTFWDENRESLIAFLLEGFRGVKGIVSDSEDDQPIKGASVVIEGREHPTNTTELGEFWRILLPGNYSMKVIAANYTTVSLDFDVQEGNATVLFIALDRNQSAVSEDATTDTPVMSTKKSPSSATRTSSPFSLWLYELTVVWCFALGGILF